MLNNFIYAQSKAMFEERLAEVPNDAIVFIEDTKEIWTHGTYFDCSTLDPNIIPNLQMEIDELKSKVVTPDWDVSNPGSSAYINGRTHYSYKITQVAKFSITNKNVGDIIWVGLSPGVFYKIYNNASGKNEVFHFTERQKVIIPANGPTVEAVCAYEDDYCLKLTTSSYGIRDVFDIYEIYVEQLNDIYIPDSIARKSEFTTINGQSITEGGNIDLVADGDEVSNLTLKPGCKIGSFSVDSSNNLASHDYEHVVISNNGITISSDDYVDYTTIKDGRLQITSERKDTPAMSIIGPNGIEIADPLRNQFDGYAIRAYDGMFGGLRPCVRVIGDNSSSSDKTLTELDHTIFINTSFDIGINLPRNPKNGQEYTILLSLPTSTPVKHLISAGTGTTIFIPRDGTTLINSISVDAHGCVKLIYIKDIGWLYYRIA